MAAIWATPAAAGDRYYAMLFASQVEPRQAKYSHSFITVVKTRQSCTDSEEQCDPCGSIVCDHTISWLPQDGEVKLWKLRSEEGVNFSLPSTIRLVKANCEKIYAWGPFEITCDAYGRFVDQKRKLDAGAKRYKAVDLVVPWFRSENCVHAITDAISNIPESHYPQWAYGEPSGRAIVKEMRRKKMIISENHNWLFDCYGLCVSCRDDCGRVVVHGMHCRDATDSPTEDAAPTP